MTEPVAYCFSDESGDLGAFDPLRPSGSRFFTVAALSIPASALHSMTMLFQRWFPPAEREWKWNHCKDIHKQTLVRELAEVIRASQGSCRVAVASLDKATLPYAFYQNPNIVHLWMTNTIVPGIVRGYSEVRFIHDERSVKEHSRNSLHESLQASLLTQSMESMHRGGVGVAMPHLVTTSARSHENPMIQLADMLAGMMRQALTRGNVPGWNNIASLISHTMVAQPVRNIEQSPHAVWNIGNLMQRADISPTV